jgi:hypothetical protein
VAEIIRIEDLGSKQNVYYAPNDKQIGEFLQHEDGFWYFWAKRDNQGCWASIVMRAIADKLDEINYLYESQLRNQ